MAFANPLAPARRWFSFIFPRGKFPRQFWLMFWGMAIATVGTSMAWPFMIIYITERLGLPLAAAASIMTINSLVQTTSAFLAGAVVDRAGRKWVMVASLLGLGIVYLLYTQASTYAVMALLMALSGLVNPLYRVGGDAMTADLVPPEDRPEAYALMRMAHNAGIAIGPAIGGFAAAYSYNVAFIGAAVGLSTYALLMAVFARETLERQPASASEPARRVYSVRRFIWQAYRKIFTDRQFVSFIGAFTLNQVCAAVIWILLGAHAKHNFGVTENQYGFIPVTNALMVVLLQAAVTRRTRWLPDLPVLSVSSLLYGVACAVIAVSGSFWGFWAGMVTMTIGELMMMPTASTYTANLAPPDMRGRYMSVFGLTWGMASAVGPLMGGILSDQVSIAAPWWMAAACGAASALGFLLLVLRQRGMKG